MLDVPADFTSILIRRKVLTAAQLRGALALQRQTKGLLSDVLVEFGYVSAEEVRLALAECHARGARNTRHEAIDLTDVVIPRAVIELVPESVARENLVIPVALVGDVLQVAMGNPDDTDTLAKLVFILDRAIEPFAAPREQVIECINRNYGAAKAESVDELCCEFTDTAIDAAHLDIQTRTYSSDALSELGDSDFDLALEESESQVAETMVADGKATQLAMDDAAREDLDGPRVPATLWGAPVAAAAPARPGVLMTARQESKSAAAPPRPLVERQATVRYYHRMSPERMFPLMVVLSRKAIREIVGRAVAQKQSKRFQVELESTVEIEPILPGCDCFPPRETVRVSPAETSAKFWVVPRVLGEVMHARVVLRQNGNVLAEVPLEMCVVKQTLTMVVGALNFGVPFVSMLLKQSQVSLAGAEAEAGLVAVLVSWVVLMLSPEVLAGLLLVATIGLYLWLRPRRREVFWDIVPTGRTAGNLK
ncbi:hypothetical protein AYO44_01820 [Planctomycetaceae bacterium SCGC AG-212-F19]|nr:hypothetical protein AYO44_01820 [Planctomycetaceae bacterium SCGC AG-212-F19]